MEVLGGGPIVPSDDYIGVGKAFKLLEQSIKLLVSDWFDCDNLAFPSMLNIALICYNIIRLVVMTFKPSWKEVNVVED